METLDAEELTNLTIRFVEYARRLVVEILQGTHILHGMTRTEFTPQEEVGVLIFGDAKIYHLVTSVVRNLDAYWEALSNSNKYKETSELFQKIDIGEFHKKKVTSVAPITLSSRDAINQYVDLITYGTETKKLMAFFQNLLSDKGTYFTTDTGAQRGPITNPSGKDGKPAFYFEILLRAVDALHQHIISIMRGANFDTERTHMQIFNDNEALQKILERGKVVLKKGQQLLNQGSGEAKGDAAIAPLSFNKEEAKAFFESGKAGLEQVWGDDREGGLNTAVEALQKLLKDDRTLIGVLQVLGVHDQFDENQIKDMEKKLQEINTLSNKADASDDDLQKNETKLLEVFRQLVMAVDEKLKKGAEESA